MWLIIILSSLSVLELPENSDNILFIPVFPVPRTPDHFLPYTSYAFLSYSRAHMILKKTTSLPQSMAHNLESLDYIILTSVSPEASWVPHTQEMLNKFWLNQIKLNQNEVRIERPSLNDVRLVLKKSVSKKRDWLGWSNKEALTNRSGNKLSYLGREWVFLTKQGLRHRGGNLGWRDLETQLPVRAGGLIV